MGRLRLPAILVLVFATACLSGCTVPVVGVTGLTVQDGSVFALVKTCPEVTADEVQMTPADGQFFLTPHPSWRFEATDEVRVELGSIEDFLGQVGDKEQGFQSTVSTGVGGYMRFIASDIESLGEGMILASTQTRSANVVVDGQGFEDLLRAVCE